MKDFGISEYDRHLQRTCKGCGCRYTVDQFLNSSENYFPKPFDYRAGCDDYCLSCWLGTGPDDEDGQASAKPQTDVRDECEPLTASAPVERGSWPYEEVYDAVMDGDVIGALRWFTDAGAIIVMFPMARLHVDRPVVYPGPFLFYPPGTVNLDILNLAPNRGETTSLAEHASFLSGVDREVLDSHPLVVFPLEFNWAMMSGASHDTHLELIRRASEHVDRHCLDYARYRLCRVGVVEDLPGQAGQVSSNPMMSGLLAFDSSRQQARVIGGAAFTHVVTKGMGLELEQLEWNEFPRDGEVGRVVEHALSLYAAMLEANSETHQFVQAMSLLEFLAGPTSYTESEKIRKIVARYSAKDCVEYAQLQDRLDQIGGKKDKAANVHTGYRTRVVHIGERIEQILPDMKERKAFFRELDGYIRAVIDHMVARSEMTWAEYEAEREKLRPYEIQPRQSTATKPGRRGE